MKNILKKLIFFTQKNPKLYSLLYSIITFNFNYLSLKLSRKKYPSKFGGIWTDRSDFEKIAYNKIKNEKLTYSDVEMLRDWSANGYIVLRNAIDHSLIDSYLDETKYLLDQEPCKLKITASSLKQPTIYSKIDFKENYSVRIVDDYYYSDFSRKILMNSTIINFLTKIYNRPPILTQSLRFNTGSEQLIHQDTAYVRMNSPMTMIGAWIALEDIQEGSGELCYYPTGHKWEGPLFSGKFKYYDEKRDGQEQLAYWHKWIKNEAERRKVDLQKFNPLKGDVLFWHAGLPHGGLPIKNTNSTRLSLVGHYCPQGVRPLYHYYRPSQRKFIYSSNNIFTTSYYK